MPSASIMNALQFLTVLLVGMRGASAFVPSSLGYCRTRSPLHSSVLDVDAATASTDVAPQAKEDLVQVAQRLKNEYGLFLVDSKAKQQLKNAVEALEQAGIPPSSWTDDLWGDWELICTTASNADGVDTSRLPFFDTGPLKQIRDAIRNTANKYLTVTQRIRGDDDVDGTDAMPPSSGAQSLSRIDHVLEYRPPGELRDVLDNLPEQLTSVNINPLQVSRSKLVLVHKATVAEGSSVEPLKIQLSLKSIVLNVAGKSTLLDPTGKDVSSLNLPLGEFLNTGSFTTTYVDRDVRISRGPQGFAEQLRVFVRLGAHSDKESTPRGTGVSSSLDVDDTMDPEFGNIQSPSDVED
jgi:PAP_fibrillin